MGAPEPDPAGRSALPTIAVGIVLAAVLAGCASTGSEFRQQNLEWREARVERLTAPYGWLSLVGLETLPPGERVSIGSGPDSDVRVDRGPARWGVIHVSPDGRAAEFAVDEGSIGRVTVDGEIRGVAPMRLDRGDGDPTRVEADGVRVHLVDPGGALALRIRDPRAPSRTGFAGIDYYELDPEWRVEAEFIAHPEGRTIQVANVMGQLIDEPNPGRVRFEHQGRTLTLEAVDSGDDLFYIFADRTSGRETYGLGRFLYSDLPVNGRVVLDFNQAYNPPCAFNAFTTCPLPPPGNRLDAWVRAGERTYRGEPGIEKPKPVRR